MTAVPVTEGERGFRYADTGLVCLGHRSASVGTPGWGEERQTPEGALIAYARAPLRVRFESDEPAMLTGATVATPGAHHAYTSEPAGERGEETTFFRFRDDTIARMAGEHDPRALDRPGRPIPWCVSPADPVAGALVRRVAARAFEPGAGADHLWLEEALLAVARRTVRAVYRVRGGPEARAPRGGAVHAEAVRAVCAHMARHYGQPLSVDGLSRIAGYTPGHFSRIFRRTTGTTMHRYLTVLRVMGAAERLPGRRGQLARLAHETGFSNHAHLTSVFTRLVGAAPSAFADGQLGGVFELLSDRLDTATPGGRAGVGA